MQCKYDSKIGFPPTLEGEDLVLIYSPANELNFFGILNSDYQFNTKITINQKISETIDEYLFDVDGPFTKLSDEIERLTVDRKSLRVIYSHYGGFRGAGYIYYECQLLNKESYESISEAYVKVKNELFKTRKI